ncbi:MAG: Trm112 family protein [Candidatus Zixiibacteriota bacterium]|nr:MAG: Trm112 family protein [candidate division Zixibacteria bacterium]
MLPDKLLEKLVCPQCRGKLQYLSDAEKLLCDRCRLAYRIDNGVPVLLIDEAEKLT